MTGLCTAMLWSRSPSKRRERKLQQRLLFHLVGRVRTRGWTGRGRTLHGTESRSAGQPLQLRGEEVERSHVGRLLLHPHDFSRAAVLRKGSFQLHFGQGKHLLQKYNGRSIIAPALALPAQLVPDLARADDDPLG